MPRLVKLSSIKVEMRHNPTNNVKSHKNERVIMSSGLITKFTIGAEVGVVSPSSYAYVVFVCTVHRNFTTRLLKLLL